MEKSRNLSSRFSTLCVEPRLSVDVGETAGMEYRSPPLVCSVNLLSFFPSSDGARFPFGVDDSNGGVRGGGGGGEGAIFGLDFEPLGPQ